MKRSMKNEFTAIIERDGDWFIATCPEIPGANGQGHTLEEVRQNLSEAISLILQDRRDDHVGEINTDLHAEETCAGSCYDSAMEKIS